jgi:hypothetical protein
MDGEDEEGRQVRKDRRRNGRQERKESSKVGRAVKGRHRMGVEWR